MNNQGNRVLAVTKNIMWTLAVNLIYKIKKIINKLDNNIIV